MRPQHTTHPGPYFRNGLLCFPEWTVNLLVGAGLDPRTGQTAISGLHLDDAPALRQIQAAAAALLARFGPDHAAAAALASADVQFMLTGVPAPQQG